MKYIITADWHISNKYPYSTDVNPLEDIFHKQVLSGAKQTIDRAAESNSVIILDGDFLNSEIISSPDFYTATLLFAYARKKNVIIYLNLGNHEIDYISTVPSVIQTIARQFPNIKTINSKEKYSRYELDGDHIYLVPYYKEEVFDDVIKEINFKDNSILVIHQNIKGIRLSNGASLKEGIDESLLSSLKGKVKLIICGHIHHRLNTVKFGIPFIIPGSICSFDFRDEKSIKSFYEVKFIDGKIDVVDNYIENQIKFETIDMSDLLAHADMWGLEFKRKFIKLRYTMQEGPELKIISDKLIGRGAIKVLPEMIPERSGTDLTAYARPIEMSIDDWFTIWLKQHEMCFEDDEINKLVELNKELFK